MSITVPTNSHTDTFYIVDFDRTLIDSDKPLEVFISIASQYIDISLEEVKSIDLEIKAQGHSFDAASYLREQMMNIGSLAQWHRLEKQYIHEARSVDILPPGAAQLLDFFQTTDRHYGILTYGNPRWQYLKLSACGLDHVPRIITGDKAKSRLIASWQRDDGVFVLPGEFGEREAARIVLIDDKAASFVGFPVAPSHGYQVLDLMTALPSQRGAIPPNVTRVATLHEVVGLLSHG